jgi:hypothetical protein
MIEPRTMADEFDEWLSSSLPDKAPPGVIAYFLGLHELGDPATNETFVAIGIIGTETYDADDEDWACEGIWNPTTPEFLIDYAVFDNDYEVAEAEIAKIIAGFIHRKRPGSELLRQAKCVATGFPDGDLITVYPTQ